MEHNVTVVILAAGLGTRMRSAQAKVLHKAGGETLLNNVIRAALHVAPAERIIAVIGHQADRVRQSVTTAGIRFAIQREQRGTGHAVLCARAEVSEAGGLLLILNGDGPLLKPETLKKLVAQSAAGPGDSGGAIVTTRVKDATGYGRIVRAGDGTVAAIVEQKVATAEQLRIDEVNPGVYCFRGEPFWAAIQEVRPNNPANEYYLTDVIGILRERGHHVTPLLTADETELLGINTRVELAVADRILRARRAEQLLLSGVTMQFPETVTIDADVEIGQDTILEANTHLLGRTIVGSNCIIGTGSVLRDCVIEDGVNLLPYVVAEASTFRAGSSVGPFARMRLDAEVGEDAHVGNFVELKKAILGKGVKAGHLTYLGDASVGAGTNVGAGTITCNYDGERKHRTTIGEGAFIGSHSTLVAPVNVQNGAYTAAGSTITKDVSADALAIGRAHQVEKEGWAARRRAKKRSPDGSSSGT